MFLFNSNQYVTCAVKFRLSLHIDDYITLKDSPRIPFFFSDSSISSACSATATTYREYSWIIILWCNCKSFDLRERRKVICIFADKDEKFVLLFQHDILTSDHILSCLTCYRKTYTIRNALHGKATEIHL